ncbi:MAG: peptidylprolyl isomerase [Acidobacteriaceae bacterium]|nr:peptidylprolyl isomerase [Acidobacteriaceae bacterium]
MRTGTTVSLAGIVALLGCVLSLAAGQTRNPSPGNPSHKASSPGAPALPSVALPSEPGRYAVIYTSMGTIVCRLLEKEAPKTVANFIALATGTKPWKDPVTGKLRHTPLYSGTTFHRVIPDFMIQGGDPAGDGTGGPGYEFPDEISANRSFDRPGLLAMANHGPDTNGSQFFITVAPAAHLDGHYSLFGEVVSGQEVANAISQVPRNSDDKPLTPVKILKIAIEKVPASGAANSNK